MKQIYILILAALFFTCTSVGTEELNTNPDIESVTRAYQNVPTLPTNWSKISERNGVVFGNRTYTRSNAAYVDFVTIADLSAGATIKLRQGSNATATNSTGNYSPTFTNKPLSHASGTEKIWYWTSFNTNKSFSMSNLQFFGFTNTTESSKMSFPLKENNVIISCGSGNNENLLKRKIGINGSSITVAEYTNTSNSYSNVVNNLLNPTVLVGLHPDANKSATSLVPRTYLAKKGTKLIVYNSRGATQSQIKTILINEFGVLQSDIIMFDGGGSTQLVNLGTQYINSTATRKIPSVIEIKSY